MSDKSGSFLDSFRDGEHFHAQEMTEKQNPLESVASLQYVDPFVSNVNQVFSTPASEVSLKQSPDISPLHYNSGSSIQHFVPSLALQDNLSQPESYSLLQP